MSNNHPSDSSEEDTGDAKAQKAENDASRPAPSRPAPSTSEPDADEDRSSASESADVEDLMEELERLRDEVSQLRARQTASRHASWVQRHPALTVFLTTALGAAAGYAGSQVGASSDFSQSTRKQLRSLAEQARTVAADVQEGFETLAPAQKRTGGSDGSSAANGAGQNATASETHTAGNGAAVGTILRRVAGTASKAGDSVRSSAKSATQDAAAQAVRTFASDDDLVPVEMKAKAAGMAATTLGAALARKLFRSAGRIAASMLIAFLTKKVLDFVLRR